MVSKVLHFDSSRNTFGIGIAKEENDNVEILSNAKSVFRPKTGFGIHPIEAANHHKSASERVLEDALKAAGIDLEDIDIISYSAGPGLPPCLRVGCEFAKSLAKKINKPEHIGSNPLDAKSIDARGVSQQGAIPLMEVNHCIAHIEIGRYTCKALVDRRKPVRRRRRHTPMRHALDPITLYVSGGNTQIIGYAAGRYRVFGETLDISIGNAIDTFIRETNGKFPGGPEMESLAEHGKYVELPYIVKGMDLSFSGILTSALQKYRKGMDINDLCFSFQETCYSMLAEVTERALAHTGKNEVLLTGGVAASRRLQEMLRIMCSERKADFYACPREFAGDCGANIAYTGLLAYKHGQKPAAKADFYPRWRTDDVEIKWV